MEQPSRRRQRSEALTPLVLAGVCVTLWPWAGWSWWPWLYGLAALVVLRVLRLNAWISERAALSIALGVVLVALSQRVSPWAFGTTAGLLLAGVGGLAIARQLPWDVPRRMAVTGITVGLLLSTVFLTMYVVHAQQEEAGRERAEQIAREERMARAMPRTPQALVRSLLGNIAELDVHRVCVWRLSETARQQFAEAWNAPDCPTAVQAMHAEIRDVRTYVSDLWPPAHIFTPRTAGPRVHANACQLEWGNILTGSPLTPPGPPARQTHPGTATPARLPSDPLPAV